LENVLPATSSGCFFGYCSNLFPEIGAIAGTFKDSRKKAARKTRHWCNAGHGYWAIQPMAFKGTLAAGPVRERLTGKTCLGTPTAANGLPGGWHFGNFKRLP
jgi:hypothetical protein